MSATNAVWEIAVCDTEVTSFWIASPTAASRPATGPSEFRNRCPEHLLGGQAQDADEAKYYQLEQALGATGKAQLYVRVVVYPPLMKADVMPTLKKSSIVAILSIAGAICIILLFSVIAFRPLGRLDHLLDLVAQGDDPKEELPSPRAAADEFGVMASKVNLLGQALRGASVRFHRSARQLRRLLDQLEDAVLIFGRDRRLVVAAGAVENFLGRTRSELIGSPLAEVFPPAHYHSG